MKMQFRKCICTFLILALMITSVNAAGISDSLAGKSSTEAATIKAQAIVNDSAVKAISKDYIEPITSAGKTVGELNIKSITYDEKRDAVKVVYTAKFNGYDKAIVNPVYIKNPPVRIVTGTREVDVQDNPAGVEYITEENPKQALLETLLQVAASKPYGSPTFIPGDPTLVVYANAADICIGNSTPFPYTNTKNFTYSQISRSGVGDSYSRGTDTGASDTTGVISLDTALLTNNFTGIFRQYEPFDTSSIGSTSTVTSAALLIQGSGAAYNQTGYHSIGISRGNPTNPTSIVYADYQNLDHVPLSNNITNSSWTTGYNIFNLTNTTTISKTGYTTLVLRETDDMDGVFSGTWASRKLNLFRVKTADTSGTTSDPYMEIIFVENLTPPSAAFSCTPLAGDAPLPVVCTDASTGGGFSSWNWSFGDGSYADTQNASHTYTGLGVYSVNLTVTNLLGSDFEYKLNYINVTTHPAGINITARTHFVFNGTNQSEVTNWSWKFSDDGNTTTFYGQDIEHWLEWGLTHVATLTAAEGVNTTTIYETINLQGGSSGSSSSGGASMAQDDTIAYTMGFLSLIGVAIAIGLALAGKNGKRRRNEKQ